MTRDVMSYNDDLRLAHAIADSVDSLTMSRFKAQDLQVDTKPDLTPVTDADRSAEEAIRSQLARSRPRDAVLGEEFGSTGHGSRRWVIDPIDGTKNFVRGVPVWATLISLMDEGRSVVGLVSAPALGRRWWGAEGTGSYTGKSLASATRLQVSGISDLADASLSYSSLGGWRERGQLDAMLDLHDSVWRTRAYGDFWSYCLLAEGAVDIACEPELNLYDMAALVPIITEAGGRFTSLDGEDGCLGGNALATNSRLHNATLAVLNGASAPSSTPVGILGSEADRQSAGAEHTPGTHRAGGPLEGDSTGLPFAGRHASPWENA